MMKSSEIRHRQHAPDRNSLLMYLEEIHDFPLLSREEEIELGARIRAGDQAALDKLICANLRFVVSVARKYRNNGVSLSDLVNEGNVGLMRAAERFDESRGVRFISYAIWWIRQAMFQTIADSGHAVRLPLNRVSMRFRLTRQADRLRQVLSREPTKQELSAALHIAENEVALTLPLATPYMSLDSPRGATDGAPLVDFLAGSEVEDPEVAGDYLADVLSEALAALPEREALVVRLCFGLDDGEPQTLEQIAGALGITSERVRRIRDRALAQLRRLKQPRMLAASSDRA